MIVLCYALYSRCYMYIYVFISLNELMAKLSSRSFLNRAYPTMKKHNPYTPIMIREAFGTPPRVFARYGMNTFGLLMLKLDWSLDWDMLGMSVLVFAN